MISSGSITNCFSATIRHELKQNKESTKARHFDIK